MLSTMGMNGVIAYRSAENAFGNTYKINYRYPTATGASVRAVSHADRGVMAEADRDDEA